MEAARCFLASLEGRAAQRDVAQVQASGSRRQASLRRLGLVAAPLLYWVGPAPPLATLAPTACVPAPLRDAAGQHLLDWLADEGAVVAPQLRVAVVPPFGRELVAMDFVEAAEDEYGARLKPLPEDVRLAAALLEMASSPYWQAYRESWPTEEDLFERLPIFWNGARLQEASTTMPSLGAQVRSRRALLGVASARLQTPLAGLTWAHALVSTRAVGARIDACAMLPGVDIANHSPEPNAELVVAGEPGVATGRATLTSRGEVWEHGTAGLVALKDIAPGEPVRISYGGYPNQRLLLDYGFSLGASNPKGDREEEELTPSTNGWERED